MTIDELARRLDVAAGGFAAFKAELDRGEPAFDRTGPGAQEVAGLISQAWHAQAAAADGLAREAAGLAAKVRDAAAGYREIDDHVRDQRGLT